MADEIDILLNALSCQLLAGNRQSARHLIAEAIESACHDANTKAMLYREKWLKAKDRVETGRKIK